MSVIRGVPISVTTNGWATGTYTDIDETINNVNETDLISTTTDPSSIVMGVDSAATLGITNSDYIKQLEVRCWARTNGSGNDLVSHQINGNAGSPEALLSTYGCHAGVSLLNRNLGTNWVTNWNALTIELIAEQSGMPTALAVDVAACEYIVQLFKPNPPVGELAYYADAHCNAVSSVTATFPNSHTAKSGNILIAMIADGTGPTITYQDPTGYTQLQSAVGLNEGWETWWKVSDGTETAVTINTDSGNFFLGSAWLIEIEWGRGTPTIQTATDISTINTVNTQTKASPSITPNNTSQNVVMALWGFGFGGSIRSGNNIDDDAWEYYGTAPDLLTQNGGGSNFAWALKSDVSGAQSVTFSDTRDTGNGCQMWGASVVFNAPAAGKNELDFERGTQRGVSRGIGRGI